MKKKYIILFILLLLCSGCSYKYASITRSIRHSGFIVANNTFKCDAIFGKKEVINDKVRFYIGNYMISESGNIYETNLGKVYSNDYNCRKPDFKGTIFAVFDLNVLKDSEGDYYYIGGNDKVAAFSKVSETDQDYTLYDILLKDTDVVKASTVNSKTGEFYVLKSDGNIYQYKIINNNGQYITDSINLLYSASDFGANILDFNYNGSSTTTFVKTEKAYYRMKVTNSKECSKYADVPCKYEMAEDTELTKVMDKVLAYNGGTLITTYGKIFNATN